MDSCWLVYELRKLLRYIRNADCITKSSVFYVRFLSTPRTILSMVAAYILSRSARTSTGSVRRVLIVAPWVAHHNSSRHSRGEKLASNRPHAD